LKEQQKAMLIYVSDDEKYVIMFNRYEAKYHWLRIDQITNEDFKEDTVKVYNQNMIKHPENHKTSDFFLERSNLYTRDEKGSFFKLTVPIIEWEAYLNQHKEFKQEDFLAT
jgi:hypothetical protein